MNFIIQIERIQRAADLIGAAKTGSPDEFARRLRVSRRQLYNLIDFLKAQGAPIAYSRERRTFFFTRPGFRLEIIFSIKSLGDDDTQNISGGVSLRALTDLYTHND